MRQDEKNLKRCLNGFISIFVCVPRVLKGHGVYETAEWGKTSTSVLRGRLLELTLKSLKRDLSVSFCRKKLRIPAFPPLARPTASKALAHPTCTRTKHA